MSLGLQSKPYYQQFENTTRWAELQRHAHGRPVILRLWGCYVPQQDLQACDDPRTPCDPHTTGNSEGRTGAKGGLITDSTKLEVSKSATTRVRREDLRERTLSQVQVARETLAETLTAPSVANVYNGGKEDTRRPDTRDRPSAVDG